jgi:cytoskeleton protein RodZ
MGKNSKQSDATEEQKESKKQKAFGAEIKKARENQQMSQVDLADQLKISVQLLDHIEQMQMSELPAPAFVKGYIRKISTILDLDADALVSDFTTRGEEDPELNSTSSAIKQKKMNDPTVVWGTIAIIVVVVILLLVWIIDAVSPSETTTSEEPVADTVSSPAEIELPVAPTEAAEPLEDGTTNDSEADADVESQTTATNTEQATSADEATQPSGVEEVKDENGISVARIFPSAPEGTDTLKVTFTGSTWADIKDASGYQLIYGLLTESRGTVSVAGQAPFSVFFGDARNASLEVNDTNFTFANAIKSNNTARFTAR